MNEEKNNTNAETKTKRRKTFKELENLEKLLVIGAILGFVLTAVFIVLQLAKVFNFALNVAIFALTFAFLCQAIRMKKYNPQSFSMYVFLTIMAGVSAIMICIV